MPLCVDNMKKELRSVLAFNKSMPFLRYFWSLMLLVLSCNREDNVVGEPCMKKIFVTPVPNKVLTNHVINTVTVKSAEVCKIQCFIEIKCESYNFGPKEDSGHVCELSDSDSIRDPLDWIIKKGFLYVETQNPCRKVNCPVNARCHSDFENDTYTCACLLGFTGNNCEDIDECKEGLHDCHSNATCNNTKGSYNYTCKPGFRGDGRNSCQALPGWYFNSCKDIQGSEYTREDGEYWIDPEKNGNPLKVHCDMTTDGGGWLLVASIVPNASLSGLQFSVETSYRGIGRNHANKSFILTKNAMKELRRHMPFTQLRFYCSKQQSRTIHVTTVANSTGEAVVQYFSGQTNVQPEACGSFVRMEDDNSLLAGLCQQWGRENRKYYVGKWGVDYAYQNRLYNHPAFVAHRYHWLLLPGAQRMECDDINLKRNSLSTGDFWNIFVR